MTIRGQRSDDLSREGNRWQRPTFLVSPTRDEHWELARTGNHSEVLHEPLRLDEAVFLKNIENLQGHLQ